MDVLVASPSGIFGCGGAGFGEDVSPSVALETARRTRQRDVLGCKRTEARAGGDKQKPTE